MTETTFAQQVNAMQRMLALPGTMAGPMRENACAFWENQDKLLSEMQDFANGWFERRHTGTHHALEAAERMCQAENPLDLMREYQNWASGAFGRVIADGMACQRYAMASFGAFTRFAEERENKSTETHIKPAPRKAA
jgi:hypothetical protein